MIGITTVIYNKLDFCQQAIEAVLSKTKEPFFYVLVFNASPYPKVKEYVEGLEGKVDKVIYNQTNIGVSAAYAQGFDLCAKEGCIYFVKLDDDTVMQTESWDNIMLDAFSRFERLGILSADLDAGKMDGPYTISGKGDIRIEEFENPCVGGAATMYPMWLFESIGFFKNFGLYAWEDYDICVRAKEANFRTAYIQNVKALHLARTENSDKDYDFWKLAVHHSQETRDYPTWLREEFGREVK